MHIGARDLRTSRVIVVTCEINGACFRSTLHLHTTFKILACRSNVDNGSLAIAYQSLGSNRQVRDFPCWGQLLAYRTGSQMLTRE